MARSASAGSAQTRARDSRGAGGLRVSRAACPPTWSVRQRVAVCLTGRPPPQLLRIHWAWSAARPSLSGLPSWLALHELALALAHWSARSAHCCSRQSLVDSCSCFTRSGPGIMDEWAQARCEVSSFCSYSIIHFTCAIESECASCGITATTITWTPVRTCPEHLGKALIRLGWSAFPLDEVTWPFLLFCRLRR